MWFDAGCPFTWRTSRWLRAVAPRRGATVDWRIMSLAILNEDKEIPEEFRGMLGWSLGTQRLLLATREAHGSDAVDRLYTAIGTRLHDQGAEPGRALLVDALAEAGLPAELVDAADDEGLTEALRASHREGQERVGTESGSPIVALGDGPGFFGPVVVPIPEDEAGDRLFDALALLSTVPQFSELKRSRNAF